MTCEPQESMDIDSAGGSEKSPCGLKENGFKLYPVSASDSGEGLPYAPENWPNLGDKWGWKAGRRITNTGYFTDRYIYPPIRLCQDGKARSFKSRLSLEQYIRAKFPDADVYAFFASFSWEIPSKLCEEDDKEISKSSDVISEHPPSDNDLRCEAGNRVCSSLGAGEKLAMFCDICCNEPGFCRDCCCILCCKTISEAFGGYDYIRCEANIEGYICGHNCHIDCALRAYMVGTVGGRMGLDAEYYCRRCDSRTDLVSHVKKLVKNCESIDSRGDIEMVLKVCIRVLRGSKKTNANHLLHQIELAMEKLKKKAEAGDIWKKEDTSAVTSSISLIEERSLRVQIEEIGSFKTGRSGGVSHSALIPASTEPDGVSWNLGLGTILPGEIEKLKDLSPLQLVQSSFKHIELAKHQIAQLGIQIEDALFDRSITNTKVDNIDVAHRALMVDVESLRAENEKLLKLNADIATEKENILKEKNDLSLLIKNMEDDFKNQIEKAKKSQFNDGFAYGYKQRTQEILTYLGQTTSPDHNLEL